MLVNGVRRWGLPAALVGLLLVASAVAALGPAPSSSVDPMKPVHKLEATVHARLDPLVEKAAATVPSPSDAPDAPPAPDVPTADSVHDAAVTAVDKVQQAAPSALDLVNVALDAAKKTKAQVDDTIAELPAITGGDDGDASRDEAPQVQSQAAVPQGSLLVAGSILVVGAAAAAATYVVLWMAGSSGTLGAGAATPELRRLLPFASPLFTRFERDTVLGHPRREQLYARILQEPGISLQDLGEATGLSRTAVVHHLRLLEHQHLVISRRVGRSRHYYENGGRYGHDQKEAYAILRNDRSKAVADFIRSHPGTMQKSLCEALAIPPSIAHWHVRRLTEGGLVQSIRQGRAVAYFPGAAMAAITGTQAAAAMAASAPSV